VYLWNPSSAKAIYATDGNGVEAPPGAGEGEGHYQIVATAEEKLYAFVGLLSFQVPKLYQYDRGWQAIDLPLAAATLVDSPYNLFHDPATGATLVALPDLSGGWILDGKDCNDITIAPFFWRVSAGSPSANIAYPVVTQFYDANIVIVYAWQSQARELQSQRLRHRCPQTVEGR
jgi:hypothetical protein